MDCKRVAGEYRWVGWTREVVVIERDHPKRIADNGPREWTVARCVLCHGRKTARENRKGEAPVTSSGKGQKRGKRPSNAPSSSVWGWRLVGAVFLAVALWLWVRDLSAPSFRAPGSPQAPNMVPVLLFACVVAAVAVGHTLWRLRRAKRNERLLRLADRLAKETHTDPSQVRVHARRWAHGSPVSASFTYGPYFDDVEGSVDRERVERLIRSKIAVPLVVSWDPPNDTVTWVPQGPPSETVPAPVPTQHLALQMNVEQAVTAGIKGSRVEWGNTDAIGPKSFTVHYPATYPDDDDAARQALLERVMAKTDLRWRPTWRTVENFVRFDRRPKMPSMIPNPILPVDADTWKIPIGTDDGGDEVVWDMHAAPHALVVGPTKSGKTVLLRSIMVDATLLGFTVFGVDPKRIELSTLRDWPGVRKVATAIEEMLALVAALADEMEARYAALEAGDVTEDDLAPILVVLDEMAEFTRKANAWWKENKPRNGTGSEHPVIERFRSMAALGRSGRIHLVVATQRPDARFLGGEARDNFGFRIALGPLSRDGALMVFGSADVGRDVPRSVKGRATVDCDGKITEVQAYFTPNPRDHTDADRRHLGMLVKAATDRGAGVDKPLAAVSLKRLIGAATGRARGGTATAAVWESVAVSALTAGDVVQVDENGSMVEVTVTDVIGDSDEFEVSYRRVDGSESVLVVDRDRAFARRVD